MEGRNEKGREMRKGKEKLYKKGRKKGKDGAGTVERRRKKKKGFTNREGKLRRSWKEGRTAKDKKVRRK